VPWAGHPIIIRPIVIIGAIVGVRPIIISVGSIIGIGPIIISVGPIVGVGPIISVGAIVGVGSPVSPRSTPPAVHMLYETVIRHGRFVDMSNAADRQRQSLAWC
jgi:hypothetical protein